MKVTKAMTEKAITANRENAAKSTGPSQTHFVSQNARTHGLLSRKLTFQSTDERKEFRQLVRDLEQDRQPVGLMEQLLVEEAATCLWKLRSANGLESKELEHRRAASRSIMATLAESHDQERLPLFTQGDGQPSAAQLGWDCEELVVRCERKDSEHERETYGGRNSVTGNLQIEARLATSMDSIMRYQSGLKRDLYRAIASLRDMQRARREDG